MSFVKEKKKCNIYLTLLSASANGFAVMFILFGVMQPFALDRVFGLTT